MILVLTLTGCETTKVLIYPVIITPELPAEPTHEKWQFISIDENNQLISNVDAQKVGTYIIDLKEYAETMRLWLEYYIDQNKSLEDQVAEIK